MNERIEKIKQHIKDHRVAYSSIGTSMVYISLAFIFSAKKNDGWQAFTLNQEQRKAFARNPDAVVVFPKERVIITGQSWNPNK